MRKKADKGKRVRRMKLVVGITPETSLTGIRMSLEVSLKAVRERRGKKIGLEVERPVRLSQLNLTGRENKIGRVIGGEGGKGIQTDSGIRLTCADLRHNEHKQRKYLCIGGID